jgi:aryl-alcohol dehydrogenase-like predicted oxidoreductase
MYFDSEDLLGKWFAVNPEKRSDIFLSTKFGEVRISDGKPYTDSSPEYCRKAITRSLSRLGLDHVDLYYIHRLDRKTPIELTMQVMVELKTEGKIRHIGLSECSAESLRRAHAVHPIAAVQMEYSLFSLDIESPERNLLQTARELGVAVVAYSPLGKGLLTGTIRTTEDLMGEGDYRRILPRAQGDNLAKNLELVDRLAAMAEKKGVTSGQLALAWLLKQGDDVFPIPGTRKMARLEENLSSLDVQISDEEQLEIRKLADHVVGTRLPEMHLHTLFADTPPLKG